MTQTVEGFLGGKTRTATFADEAFGTTYGGRIVDEPQMMQQRDYNTNEPKFYPDSGKPMMQLVVRVQTSERDADDPDDDGVRALYVKGQMRVALIAALKAAGAKAPAVGGELYVRYVRDEPTTLANGKKGNPQKIYECRYVSPAAGAAGAYLAEGGDQAAPTGATPAAAAAQAAAAPALDSPSLPCPPSVAAGKWAAMSIEQQRQMYDALGLDVPPF